MKLMKFLQKNSPAQSPCAFYSSQHTSSTPCASLSMPLRKEDGKAQLIVQGFGTTALQLHALCLFHLPPFTNQQSPLPLAFANAARSLLNVTITPELQVPATTTCAVRTHAEGARGNARPAALQHVFLFVCLHPQSASNTNLSQEPACTVLEASRLLEIAGASLLGAAANPPAILTRSDLISTHSECKTCLPSNTTQLSSVRLISVQLISF